MITIPVKVCGDSWLNPEEVENLLYQSNLSDLIHLNFQAEGPSMHALGIVNLLDRYCEQTGRPKNTIYIFNNSNTVEKIEYQRHNPGQSHFFKMSNNYWIEPLPLNENYKKFGYFMGRRTLSRVKILSDLWHNYQDQCLFSVMNSHGAPSWTQVQGIQLEKLSDWAEPNNNFNCYDWFQHHCTIGSIDGHFIRDQYVETPTTNLDLLKHYNSFAVEIVAETFTVGDTFFPTEKTVRPLMAGKPIILYGPKNFLSRLRTLGFETYESCWDESYDQLEGPARWNAMFEILDQVKLTDQVKQITEHNRKNLKKISES